MQVASILGQMADMKPLMNDFGLKIWSFHPGNKSHFFLHKYAALNPLQFTTRGIVQHKELFTSNQNI